MRQPRSDVARNRRLLVEAAIESFRELGWDAPLDTVARRAGVGNATLYRHFPTREDLYEAAFAEIRERLAAVLERHRDVQDAWQGLTGLLFDIYATAPVGPPAREPVEEQLRSSPSLTWIVTHTRATVARVLRVAQAQGTVRDDVDLADLVLLLDSVVPVIVASEGLGAGLWHRHLALLLEAVRSGPAHPLPPPVADVEERLRAARPPHRG